MRRRTTTAEARGRGLRRRRACGPRESFRQGVAAPPIPPLHRPSRPGTHPSRERSARVPRMAEVETTRDDAVLTITLNRPDVLNALNAAMHAGLATALKEAARDDDVRAVVLTGAGRGFCVGQDLSEFREAAGDISERLRATYHPNVLAIRSLEKPVIAAINGAAAGAGVSFACACDIRIAAD